MAISPCPVCELQLAAPTPIPNTRTLALNCHRCGSYDLTLEALHMLRDEIGRQPLRRAITSHAIQQINSTGSAPHKVTQDWLQSVWTHGKLPSPQEQADIFIKYLGAANVPSGSWVRCNPQHLTGLLGTADDPTRSETSGFVFIVNALKNRRFRAKPCKKIVDGQAASPSSWKMPRIAPWMV